MTKNLFPILLLTGGSILLSGCGSSQEDFVITNTVLMPSPVARADAYTTVVDTPLTLAAVAGVLANDTLNGTSITVTFPATTNQGGTLSQVGNTGAFTYTPANGFVGTDTFSYTVANGFGSASATVTITVTAAPVITPGFFVDSSGGNDATGDFATGSPFATVQAAVAAAGPNSDIVIVPGRGRYEGTVNLLDGQRLLGSGSTLVNAQNVSPPNLSGPIVLADGNTLDFLRVGVTNGIAIDGDGQNSGTVTNCEIAGTTTGTGLQIRGVRGNWTIENNTITMTDGIGCDMDTQGDDTATIYVNNNNISGSGAFGIGYAAIGNSQLTVQCNDNVLTNNQIGFTVVALSTGTSTLCLQILGNENDNVYRFNRLSDTAVINVEQFADLETLNTGTVVNADPTRPITDVPAGFCGF
jgi:hypothetical protein